MSDARPATVRHDVFAVLWALAGLIHVASFSGWRWDHPLGWAYVASVAAVLVRPGSLPFLAAFAAIDLAGIAYAAPKHPNHILFTALVDAALLATILPRVLRREAPDAAKEAALRSWGPAVRLSVLVLYAYAVLHKLNTSYFDPSVSGSAVMYRMVAERLPGLPAGTAFESAAIWIVIAAEAAIPILLVCRRTAVAGVVVALVFHALLGLHPQRGVYSFSATILPLVWLFLPDGRIAAFAAPRWTRVARWSAAGLLVVGYVAVQIARARGADDIEVWATMLDAGHWIWGACTALVAWAFVCWMRGTRDGPAAPSPPWMPETRALLIVPALAVLNGLCPYLGFKTESSFSMFSNLATERGRTNHLLVPAAVQVTDWLRDTCDVLDSSKPDLARFRSERYAVTYMQLRLVRTREPKGFRVTFVRDGETRVFDASRPETHASLPEVPWILTKLLQFRPVDLDDAVRSRH